MPCGSCGIFRVGTKNRMADTPDWNLVIRVLRDSNLVLGYEVSAEETTE